MGIEFNPNIGKVNNVSGANLEGGVNNLSKSPLLSGAGSSLGVGVTLESGLTALLNHFAQVPDKPEFNIKQENLVINGPLMGGAEEELLEV